MCVCVFGLWGGILANVWSCLLIFMRHVRMHLKVPLRRGEKKKLGLGVQTPAKQISPETFSLFFLR